eukprot:XP_001706550.1 Hypothetical protein GL50803_37517 [Giardia lamblia ATCC 50803]
MECGDAAPAFDRRRSRGEGRMQQEGNGRRYHYNEILGQ